MSIAWAFPLSLLQRLMQELPCPFLGLFLHPSLHGLSLSLQTSRVNHHCFLKMWPGVAIVRALDAQL